MRRILVVEDSETMQEILSSTLDQLGEPVEVTLAATGFEAVRCPARGLIADSPRAT